MLRFSQALALTFVLVALASCTADPMVTPNDATTIDASSTDANLPDTNPTPVVDSGNCDLDGDHVPSIACGGTDCDDADAMRHPGATETCDAANRDEDCDPTSFGTRDVDADGHTSSACCNVDTAGAMHCGDDCDDARIGIHPDVPEVCNDIDDDCDVAIDEMVLLTCWTDNDGDSYPLDPSMGGVSSMSCSCPTRTTMRAPSTATIDCNDTVPEVSPGSPEICSNTRDDNCNGVVDEAGSPWIPDCDGDGYGDMTATPLMQCVPPARPPGCLAGGAGYVLDATDCNDMDSSIHPMLPDLCDGRNEDCDAATADGAGDTRVDVACDGTDADMCRNGLTLCSAAAVSCMETSPNVVEVCSGGSLPVGDEDCDGVVDEATAANADCTARALPNVVTTVCSSGSCAITACSVGHEDCNGSAGCESTCAWHGCSAGGCDAVTGIAVNRTESCATRQSGAVVCWGHDGMTAHLTPTLASATLAPIQIEANWGLLAGGQVARQYMGSGFAYTGYVPALGVVTDLGINANRGLGCFLHADGTVSCFEWNEYGQLGTGVIDGSAASAVGTVVGLSDAVEVTAGNLFACARRRGGTVVCWGANYYGQLGDGVATHAACASGGTGADCSGTPVTVSGITDAVEIAAQGESACARLSTGEVRCWGRGSGVRGPTLCPGHDAQPANCSRTPVSVPSVTFTRIFPGGGPEMLAVAGDGTLRRIEVNNFATLLPGVSGVTDAEYDWDHYCVVAAGSVSCAGTNTSGQVGDGTMTSRASLVPVLSPP